MSECILGRFSGSSYSEPEFRFHIQSSGLFEEGSGRQVLDSADLRDALERALGEQPRKHVALLGHRGGGPGTRSCIASRA